MAPWATPSDPQERPLSSRPSAPEGRHDVAVIGAGVVGCAIAAREKKKKIKIEWHYFYWMFMESIVYSVVFAVIIAKTVATIFPNPSEAPALSHRFVDLNAGATSQELGLQLALSIGAGLYEELFFRVLLVGGLFLFLDFILAIKERHTYIIAAVLGALIFSAVHYIGVYGDAFAWPSFTFRFLFGLALNALYLTRGFGIAAWSHAIYDILLTIILLKG